MLAHDLERQELGPMLREHIARLGYSTGFIDTTSRRCEIATRTELLTCEIPCPRALNGAEIMLQN